MKNYVVFTLIFGTAVTGLGATSNGTQESGVVVAQAPVNESGIAQQSLIKRIQESAAVKRAKAVAKHPVTLASIPLTLLLIGYFGWLRSMKANVPSITKLEGHGSEPLANPFPQKQVEVIEEEDRGIEAEAPNVQQQIAENPVGQAPVKDCSSELVNLFFARKNGKRFLEGKIETLSRLSNPDLLILIEGLQVEGLQEKLDEINTEIVSLEKQYPVLKVFAYNEGTIAPLPKPRKKHARVSPDIFQGDEK